MFKMLLGVVAALAIGGVAYGAADVLNITNQPVAQQGNSDVVCDEDGVQVLINEQGAVPGDSDYVDSVEVSGIDADCNGAGIRVTLLDVNGNWAAEVNSSVSGTTFTADFYPGSLVTIPNLGEVVVQLSGQVP